MGGCVSSTHSTAPYPKGTSYGDAEASPSGRSTQSAWKQCGARHARLNRVTRTIARPKEVPLGEDGRHTARQNGPKHYPGAPMGAANRGPAKAQRSGFGGERRSSGTTELLPRKAKRRMWSLRRRDGPKSRKMHYGELVVNYARLPSKPPYKSKIPKGGFGALWHAFLPYLSSCNERWGHRRSPVAERGW